MKNRLFLLILGFILTLPTFAQEPVKAHFDECLDLMSVVWRLTGANEYNLCMAEQYSKEVDATFGEFRDHPVVQLAQKYRSQSGISYDAVAAYGLHLTINESNEIVLRDIYQEGSDDSFDRWSEAQKQAFLKPLNDFYRESQFHNWYTKQQNTYERVEEAFDNINKHIDYSWFSNFFGPQKGSEFHVVLSLLVGPHNYGCSAKLKNGSNILNPVIGCCRIDDEDNINFNENDVLPIIIHEFCHHYCNPLNLQYWSLMSKTAQEIFLFKKDELQRAAYGSALTMMNETFVRAAVIRYMKTHYPTINDVELIRNEEQNGFLLTQTVCNALKRYEQNRNQYNTMSDYMPTLSDAINHFSIRDYKKTQKEYAKHLASYKVNIQNGAKGIRSGEFVVEIAFSKPMVDGIALGGSQRDCGLPEFKGYRWSDDQKTIYITFLLKPNKTYGFRVLGTLFQTLDGYTAKGDTDICFSTK